MSKTLGGRHRVAGLRRTTLAAARASGFAWRTGKVMVMMLELALPVIAGCAAGAEMLNMGFLDDGKSVLPALFNVSMFMVGVCVPVFILGRTSVLMSAEMETRASSCEVKAETIRARLEGERLAVEEMSVLDAETGRGTAPSRKRSL